MPGDVGDFLAFVSKFVTLRDTLTYTNVSSCDIWLMCTLPSMSRTVWPESEEAKEEEDESEDGSSFHIKQPQPYSLYKYRL